MSSKHDLTCNMSMRLSRPPNRKEVWFAFIYVLCYRFSDNKFKIECTKYYCPRPNMCIYIYIYIPENANTMCHTIKSHMWLNINVIQF